MDPQSTARPPRPSSEEPSSPGETPLVSIVRSTSGEISTTSEDSQTVLLNHPSNPSLEANTLKSDQPDRVTKATSTTPSTAQLEPRHCWICLQDEGEENASTSDWKSPCPCNLQAHEQCMLDWITDLEASDMQRGVAQCPQCKANINMERPMDMVVLFTTLVKNIGRELALPAGISAVAGIIYSASMVFGLNSLNLVFGDEYATRILESWVEPPRYQVSLDVIHRILRTTDPFILTVPGASFKAYVGLPLIAPALVLSRTNISHYGFSVIPLGFFVIHNQLRGVPQWPPSPALTFATLPYIRLLYIEIYRKVFGNLEKEWEKAVLRKPREGETEDELAEIQQAQGRVGLNNVLDIQLEIRQQVRIEVDGDNEPAEAPVPVPDLEGMLPQNQVIPEEALRHEIPHDTLHQNAPVPQEAPIPAVRDNNMEFRRYISSGEILNTVMGALFFPAISSIMGGLLKVTLPNSWVRFQPRYGSTYSTGLLQEKWGRSVVGGCLFVALKDALILYSKWRKAQMHRKMKVLDYKGQRKWSSN